MAKKDFIKRRANVANNFVQHTASTHLYIIAHILREEKQNYHHSSVPTNKKESTTTHFETTTTETKTTSAIAANDIINEGRLIRNQLF